MYMPTLKLEKLLVSTTARRQGACAVWVVIAVLTFTIGVISQQAEAAGIVAVSDGIVARFSVGAKTNQIGLVAGVPNQAPEGPAAIAASPGNEVFILDTLNHRLIQALPKAGAPRTIPIPQARYATDLVVTSDSFYILDALGRQVLKYDKKGKLLATFPVDNPSIDLAGSITLVVLPDDDIRIQRYGADEVRVGARTRGGAETLPDLSLSTTQGGTVQSQFNRQDETVALITLRSSARAADAPSALELNSNNFLASGELIAVDAEGRYYVLVEELTKAQPESTVQTILARYSRTGKLEAIAGIPIYSVIFLPNRFVAVTPKGQAYFLQPTEHDVRILELGFEKRDNLSLSAAAGQPVVMGESRAAPSVEEDELQKLVRDLYAEEAPPLTRGPINREQVLENAQRYLRLSWLLGPRNYQQPGVASRCSPPRAIWKRPVRLDGRVNQTVQAVPYRWGGFDSLEMFKSKLHEGYLAGDVCTCRKPQYKFCIMDKSTGVDCSGFVSRTLQERYYTTTGLQSITRPLPGFRELRPGDILNRAGSHVRLFAGFSASGPFVLKTIESAVSCGGVCTASYTVSQLARYKPLRYRNIAD